MINVAADMHMRVPQQVTVRAGSGPNGCYLLTYPCWCGVSTHPNTVTRRSDIKRIPSSAYSTAIERAFQIIPERIHPLLHHPHFLCGVDPVFAGLHDYSDIADGRSYRNTAHCAFPHNQARLASGDRWTTIVLPAPPSPRVIVHELGHVLHATLGWEPDFAPVSGYAEVNHYEAFAEAFTSHLLAGYAEDPEPAARHLFDALGL